MFGFIVRRLLLTVPVLLGVVTITFFLIHMIPGDPVDVMLGEQAALADKEALRVDLGLNQPIAVQYSRFLNGLLQFDFGRSILSRESVTDLILERIPATVELALAAMVLTLALAIPLGVLASLKQYSATDNSLLLLSLIGLSMPAILIAPLLKTFFSLKLGWLPVSERGGLEHLILPSVTLASGLVAIVLRMTRTSMLEVIRENYIDVAKAKGLPDSKVYFKHALTNALPPILTIVGLLMGALLTGVVVVETIFDWPGLGSLLLDAIQQRDYPVVQGCAIFVSFTYVMINLITDISYAVVNPKVRLE